MKAMYNKTFGFSNNQQASSSKQQQQQPQSHQRNPLPQTPQLSSKSASARLLWASFLVWHENEKASFEADFKNLCREMDMIYTISDPGSPGKVKSQQEDLKTERGVTLAEKSLKKWAEELQHNHLTWEDWSDITPEEQAQVEEVFRSAQQGPALMEHSLLQAPPLSSSTSLVRTHPYNMVDPSSFSDDADDDRMGFVDIKNYMEDSHRSHLDNEVVSDSEFVSWNAETPQTSSHSPSPRISPRHLSVHSSFENIPTLHTPIAHRASDNTKPRSGYIGPELVSSPPPSQSSSPLQDADEEAEFEKFKANVRAEKIREFHNEAAEADIQLSSEIYNAQRHGLVTKEDITKMVQMHEKRMMLVRKTKDEERKKIVAAEREKRRREIKERAAAMQGALVRRERKNTITGYTSPLLNSSGKPSLENSPGMWAQAMMKLQPSPLDTPIANFTDPPSWTSYYEAPPGQHHQSPPMTSRNMFSPPAMEPSFPGSFEPKMPAHTPRHESQASLSSSVSDDNSIWSHIGAGVSANNGGDSPATSSPSEKAGILSQGQPGSPVNAKVAPPPMAEITPKQAKASAAAAKPASLPTVSSASMSKASSVTPTSSMNGKGNQASHDRPMLHSAASQQAGVAAPQPKAPALPLVVAKAQPAPAPPKTIRKMQAVTKLPPQALSKPGPMSPVKTVPQTPLQQQKQSMALPVVPTRQTSSSSAATSGQTHERWLPPAASLSSSAAPAPASNAISQKAAGKKAESKPDPSLMFPLAKASEAKPVIKAAESKSSAPKVSESKSTNNNLPSTSSSANPPRVDASASSKVPTSSASTTTWHTQANVPWQPPAPPAKVPAPPAAPVLSASVSASASTSASSQGQKIWRPQQPQEKPKQEEKAKKQIEPAPAAAPVPSQQSSSSKKSSKKNKAKAAVQVEEIVDDDAVTKDALPVDSRYLIEPVGGIKEPKPAKPSQLFEKVLKSEGDADDGSSDGTVRAGKKNKDRKGPIPSDWSNASSSSNANINNNATDPKHTRWSPNAQLPSSMFNPHPAPTKMSASAPADESWWQNATKELTSPQKKAAVLPKKQNVESDYERLAREALQHLSVGR